MFYYRNKITAGLLCLSLCLCAGCSKTNTSETVSADTHISVTETQKETSPETNTETTQETTSAESESAAETELPPAGNTQALIPSNELLQGAWSQENGNTFKLFNGTREYQLIDNPDLLADCTPDTEQTITLDNYQITPAVYGDTLADTHILTYEGKQYLLLYYDMTEALYYDMKLSYDGMGSITENEYDQHEQTNSQTYNVKLENETTLCYYQDTNYDTLYDTYHKTDMFNNLIPLLDNDANYFDYDTAYHITETTLPGIYHVKKAYSPKNEIPVYLFREDGTLRYMICLIHDKNENLDNTSEKTDLYNENGLHIWKQSADNIHDNFFAETKNAVYELRENSYEPNDFTYTLDHDTLTICKNEAASISHITIYGYYMHCTPEKTNLEEFDLVRMNTLSKITPYLS